MAKKVKWRWDMGVYVPFCPYCDEFAYEEDCCVFCEKEYIWVDKSKDREVKVGEYTVVQASNKHISIYKGNRAVSHMSCTKRKSKRQLKKMVDLYKNTALLKEVYWKTTIVRKDSIFVAAKQMCEECRKKSELVCPDYLCPRVICAAISICEKREGSNR